MTMKTRNTKKTIFAIAAAPAAIPPNPKMAAIIAMIRNINVHRNMIHFVWLCQYIRENLATVKNLLLNPLLSLCEEK